MAELFSLVIGIALIGIGSVMAVFGTAETTTYSNSSTFIYTTTTTVSSGEPICLGFGSCSLTYTTSTFSYGNFNPVTVASTSSSFVLNYLGAVIAVMGIALIVSGLRNKRGSV